MNEITNLIKDCPCRGCRVAYNAETNTTCNEKDCYSYMQWQNQYEELAGLYQEPSLDPTEDTLQDD